MLAIISVFPVGKGDSLGREVAQAVEIISRSGINYQLTSMGTIVEGDWAEIMALANKIRIRLLRKSKRIYMTLAIDDRKGALGRMSGKVARVEALLNKAAKK